MADIDPGYGGYANTNRLLATATNGPDVANAWQTNKLLQTQNQGAQLDLAHKKLGAVYDIASSVMADPTPENAIARIQDGVRLGVIDPQSGQQELSTIASFGGDQQKIRQYAFDHAQSAASYQQRIEASGMASPSLVSNGAQQLPMVASSGLHPGIAPAGGAPIQMQQSPSELASPVTVRDANDVPHTMTASQFQTTVGQPPGAGYGAVARGQAKVVNGKIVYGGAKSAAGAPQATDAQGRAVTASGQPTAVPAPSVAPWAGSLPGIAGPTPGTATAADATAGASAAMGNALTKAADGSSGARAILSNMQDDLSKIVTGPGTERVNSAKAAANAVADMTFGQGSGPRFDQSAVAAAEQFHKNSELLAQQQQQALGGTDAGLASGHASVPNLGNSTMGNKAILAMLHGNQDAIEAKNAAWQDWQKTHGPGSYGQFAADFNKSFSPRAFQFYHMDKADRQAMFDNMNPQDREALAGAVRFAQSRGWIATGGK